MSDLSKIVKSITHLKSEKKKEEKNPHFLVQTKFHKFIQKFLQLVSRASPTRPRSMLECPAPGAVPTTANLPTNGDNSPPSNSGRRESLHRRSEQPAIHMNKHHSQHYQDHSNNSKTAALHHPIFLGYESETTNFLSKAC